MRRNLRALLGGLLTGALLVSGAWAGIGLTPAPSTVEALAPPQITPGERLPDPWFLAGAAKTSIMPDPEKWTPHDPENGVDCGEGRPPVARHTQLDQVFGDSCLATFDSNWAREVPEDLRDYGVHVRATALSNGAETVVFALMDTVSWFYGYPDDVCGDCGTKAIAEAVSAERGGTVKPEGIVIGASHTHASANTTSDIPPWYYEQVRDATKEALHAALDNLELALLETGAAAAKQYNTDRRNVTRAIPDYELTWLRAYAPGGQGAADRGIATLVNLSVHTTVLAGNDYMHDGFVGPLAEKLEERFGGLGMFFPGGLGDQTVTRSFGREGLGHGMAEIVIDDQDNAYRLESNEIVLDRTEVAIPVDSRFMAAARLARVFVRDFLPPYGGGPLVAEATRGGARRPSCVSQAEFHVIAPVGGIRIGTPGGFTPGQPADQGDALVIMQAPGEIFASISLVTKDYLSRSRNVMVLGMANDHIGYIIPATQVDETAYQGVGLLHNVTNTGDYEEALSVSRCAGDIVQNELLRSGDRLGVMGPGESP